MVQKLYSLSSHNPHWTYDSGFFFVLLSLSDYLLAQKPRDYALMLVAHKPSIRAVLCNWIGKSIYSSARCRWIWCFCLGCSDDTNACYVSLESEPREEPNSDTTPTWFCWFYTMWCWIPSVSASHSHSMHSLACSAGCALCRNVWSIGFMFYFSRFLLLIFSNFLRHPRKMIARRFLQNWGCLFTRFPIGRIQRMIIRKGCTIGSIRVYVLL